MQPRTPEQIEFIQRLKEQLPDNTYYLAETIHQWDVGNQESFEFRSKFSNTKYFQSFSNPDKLLTWEEMKEDLRENWKGLNTIQKKWFNENIEHRYDFETYTTILSGPCFNKNLTVYLDYNKEIDGYKIFVDEKLKGMFRTQKEALNCYIRKLGDC